MRFPIKKIASGMAMLPTAATAELNVWTVSRQSLSAMAGDYNAETSRHGNREVAEFCSGRSVIGSPTGLALQPPNATATANGVQVAGLLRPILIGERAMGRPDV